MSAIDFSKLPKSKHDFKIHFRQKIENTKWLGRLFEYSQKGDNKRVKKLNTQGIPQPITQPFESFPYRWDVKKSTTKITALNPPIVEDHTEFDPEETSYIISLPFHNPSIQEVKRIVRSIEDQSFDKTKRASHVSAQKRVAVVIGLNNCDSFNSEQNDKFKREIQLLRKATLSSYVSLTIIPFFWGHIWMPKGAEDLELPELFATRIHPIHGCYRIANSYFRFFRGSAENLWVDSQFNESGSPSEKTIPYQLIRNKILHSAALKQYFESSQSESKYVLSLDGDFLSLKAADSSVGLLTHYDALIEGCIKEVGSYPDVISTGYEPPKKEKNELIKAGIELDRLIRAAIAGKFVYMPEPNFAFRVTKGDNLSRLSWIGGTTMDTESRRLIESGVIRGILDSDLFVYSNRGGVQTDIDSTWRTTTVNTYQTMQPAHFMHKAVQKAIRGLHQSYADPQVWAKNVYNGFRVTVAAYVRDAIAPMKGIRELFDPITMRNVRYATLRIQASDYKTLFDIFPVYIECMRSSVSREDFDALVTEFIKEAKISGKAQREDWANFMLGQLKKLKEYTEQLQACYSGEQVGEVLEAAIATGEVIKDFYQKRMTA
jgi:hypothetical protein